MKNIFVFGSLAYDYLLSYDGKFREEIIPEELKTLSISFPAYFKESFFGGCGGNIAYNLKLLGENPLLFGVTGDDFGRYELWLKQNDINPDYIVIHYGTPTATANVLTDREQNQLAIFSLGAVGKYTGALPLGKIDFKQVALAILAPELPKRMVSVAEFLMKKRVPYIFDPGQAMSGLSKAELWELIKGCQGLVLNEYEMEMMYKKVGLKLWKISERLKFIVKTLGKDGCELYQGNSVKKIPAVKDVKLVDVTGGGDAFRAGLIHGLVNGWTLEKACQMGNVVASLAIEKQGTQRHELPKSLITKRLKQYL